MGSTYYIIDAFINATYKSFVRVNKALSYRPFLCSISPVVSFEFGSLDIFFNNRILSIIVLQPTLLRLMEFRILFFFFQHFYQAGRCELLRDKGN